MQCQTLATICVTPHHSFCKAASSRSGALHWRRSHRTRYLASLAKLDSVHGIEPDICPKAECVRYPNDLSRCFIIRDIDGGTLLFLHLALTKPMDSLLAQTMYSHLGELMCRLLSKCSSPSPSQFPKRKMACVTESKPLLCSVFLELIFHIIRKMSGHLPIIPPDRFDSLFGM